MTLRGRILLAQTPLGGALALIALLAALTNGALGRNTASMLQDNYRSVLAVAQMKEALDRLESASGPAQVAAQAARFEAALAVQRSNVTERGEPAATAALVGAWSAYRAALDRGQRGGALTAEIRHAADRILELNQDAMVRKRDAARRDADRASAAVVATALVAALIGLLASTVLTRRILRPLSVLGQTARRLGEGDMEVRAKVTRPDEIGALARDFNLMADRLAQYRRSSLGELLQAQQQAQAAIDSLPDPVLIFDLAGQLLAANQAADRVLRVTVEDAGRAPLDRAEPQVRAAVERVRARAQTEAAADPPAGADETVRVSGASPDGQDRFFLPRASRVSTDAGVVGVTVILQDVTRAARFDELKNNLVATVAHEFRTPLTSLRMAIHLCVEETVGPLTDKQLDLLQAARQDTERLQQIVDDLLDLSRIQSGRMELRRRPVAAETFLREATASFTAAARDKNITLKTEVYPGLGDLNVDPDRMHLVLANLIGNALRYTPAGGTVTVRGRQGDQGVRIEIQDTGPGIAKPYHAAVFDKFFRVPGTTAAGAGLGLYIAREITLAHDGRLTVSSEPGQGATFVVELPVQG